MRCCEPPIPIRHRGLTPSVYRVRHPWLACCLDCVGVPLSMRRLSFVLYPLWRGVSSRCECRWWESLLTHPPLGGGGGALGVARGIPVFKPTMRKALNLKQNGSQESRASDRPQLLRAGDQERKTRVARAKGWAQEEQHYRLLALEGVQRLSKQHTQGAGLVLVAATKGQQSCRNQRREPTRTSTRTRTLRRRFPLPTEEVGCPPSWHGRLYLLASSSGNESMRHGPKPFPDTHRRGTVHEPKKRRGPNLVPPAPGPP